MQRRGNAQRAALLPLQMQREHQVCPPGLPDGMAVPFSEEALRTVQNPLPLHQAILPRHAQVSALHRLRQPHCQIHISQLLGLGTCPARRLRLALLAALLDA